MKMKLLENYIRGVRSTIGEGIGVMFRCEVCKFAEEIWTEEDGSMTCPKCRGAMKEVKGETESKFDIKIKRIEGTKRFEVVFEVKVIGEIYRKAEAFWGDSYGEYHTTYGDACCVEIKRVVAESGIACDENIR